MSTEIVDLVFALEGRAVPVDYADRLWQELEALLPWLGGEEAAGVHPLGGLSGSEGELYLSRRSKLMLRLPQQRAEAAAALSGRRLDIGSGVTIGAWTLRPLSPAKVIYSSFVTTGTADEVAFLANCRELLAAAGVEAGLICGKAHRGSGRGGDWHGFSLMLHGLGAEQSLAVQRRGLGGERKRGCGIFVPHKAIAAVGE